MNLPYSNSTTDRLLGCLVQNPVLCLEDKYKLDKGEFKINKFHQILFISIYNLACNGYKSISIFDLNEFLKAYTAQYNVYLDNNGDSYIETIIELTDTENFDGYYKEFKKLSCLRAYKENGFDITNFWNEEISDEKNLENINNYEVEDILNYYDNIKIKIDKLYLQRERDIEETQAGTGLNELIEQLQEEPMFGHSFCSELMNTVTRGMMDGQLTCFSSPSGTGKAQPVDTIIPTPNGNRRLGDIKVGDYVFDRYGNPTKVIGVYPQGIMDNYKVTLKDGRITYCNNEHLWNVIIHKKFNEQEQTVNTNYIINFLNENTIDGVRKDTICLPINKAINYSEKDLPINPYVLGSFIGNGCCSERILTLSSNDEEQVNIVANLLNTQPVKVCDKNYSWYFKATEKRTYNNLPIKYLQTKDVLGYLTGLKSNNKYIDKEYKKSSINQRYELLQGLFDTDGHIKKVGKRFRVSYSTMSEQLANDIIEILYSLGYSASLIKDCRKKYNGKICYNINVLIDNSEKYKLFKLSRKKNIALEALQYPSRRHYDRIPIVSIEKTPTPCEMVCIYVDNDEHLYLTNDYIVTHNTTLAIAQVCNLCARQIWDYDTKQFIDNPCQTKHGALYIQFELDNVSELSIKFLAYISGVPFNTILNGKYTDEENLRIDTAIQILKDSNIHLSYMPNFTRKSIEQTLKEHILDYGIDFLAYDYIQDGSAINAEMVKSNGGVGLRTDQVLANLSDFLKLMARTYDIPVYTATQTNANLGSVEAVGAESIAGSRAVANKLDIGGVFLPLRPKELKARDLLEQEIGYRGFGLPHATHIYHMYKVRFGSYPQNIKIWVNVDLGTGRMKDCFATDWQNQIIKIPKTKLERINND